MHTLHIHERPYPLPSRWDELSRRQLLTLAWLIETGRESVEMAKLMFLVLTQSLPWWHRMQVRFFYLFRATVDERADMLRLCASFSESRAFTAQKIKKIGGKTVLFGPDSALSNFTLWEYIRAEQAFLQYMQSDSNGTAKARHTSSVHLDRLIAIMYRPARRDYDPDRHDDIRVPLVDSAVSGRMSRIRSLDRRTKIAILMWFDGCRSHIIRMFPLIFRKEESALNEKMKAGTVKKASSAEWLDLITSLSTDMTKFEKIANMNLIVAFTDLSNRIRQSRNKKNQK